MRTILLLSALILILFAACDTSDPDPADFWEPTGTQIFGHVGNSTPAERPIGPFAAKTHVTFSAQARAAAEGGAGSLKVEVLLDGKVICENTQTGAGTLVAQTSCAADFRAGRTRTALLRIAATGATREGGTMEVKW